MLTGQSDLLRLEWGPLGGSTGGLLSVRLTGRAGPAPCGGATSEQATRIAIIERWAFVSRPNS